MNPFTTTQSPVVPVPHVDTAAVATAIARHCGLTEVCGSDGGPRMRLRLAAMPHVEGGTLRLWRAPDESPLERLVHLFVGGRGLDVNVLYAIARQETAVPHFTLQYNVRDGDKWSYHVDLVPRCDGVLHPEYWREIYEPLTPVVHTAPLSDVKTYRIQPDRNVYLSTWGVQGMTAPLAEYCMMRDSVVPRFLAALFAAHDGLAFRIPDLALHKRRSGQLLRAMFARELERDWERLDGFFGREAVNEVHAVFAGTPN